MSIELSKKTAIYDNLNVCTGFGYPRGSINGTIRYNELKKDFEFGINEKWVTLESFKQHPLNHIIRHNTQLDDIEFLIDGVWVPRCQWPNPLPKPPLSTDTPPPKASTVKPYRPAVLHEQLTISLMPPEITTHATWHLIGYPNAYNSNQELQVKPGNYYIQCTDVVDWKTPELTNITIAGHSGHNTYTLLYEPKRFHIIVSTNETQVSEPITWCVDDGNSTNQMVTVKPGMHYINFNKINGWVTPEPIEIDATEANADHNDCIHVEVVYTKRLYKLRVLFKQTNATYTIKDKFGTHFHDELVSDLPYGEYTLRFNKIPGHITPEDMYVVLDDSLENGIAELNVLYEPKTVLLSTSVSPSKLSNEFKWSIDENQELYHYNDDIPVYIGEHMVYFYDIPGWITPPNQVINFDNDYTNYRHVIHAVYKEKSTSLLVKINPPEIRQHATWNLHGTAGRYKHGDTVSNLSIGKHKINFSSVKNWDQPLPRFINLNEYENELTIEYSPSIPVIQCMETHHNGGDEFGTFVYAIVKYQDGYETEYKIMNNITSWRCKKINEWYLSSFGRPVDYDALLFYYYMFVKHGQEHTYNQFVLSENRIKERSRGTIISIITTRCSEKIKVSTRCEEIPRKYIRKTTIGTQLKCDMTYQDNTEKSCFLLQKIQDPIANEINIWFNNYLGRNVDVDSLEYILKNYENHGKIYAESLLINSKILNHERDIKIKHILTSRCKDPQPIYQTQPRPTDVYTDVIWFDNIIAKSVKTIIIYKDKTTEVSDLVVETYDDVAEEINNLNWINLNKPINHDMMIYYYSNFINLGLKTAYNEYVNSKYYKSEKQKGDILSIIKSISKVNLN